MQIKELLDDISEKVNKHNTTVTSLKLEFDSMKQDMGEIKTTNAELLKNLNENLDVIKQTKEDFEKEFYDFKLLKSDTQKNILKKFDEELQKELVTHSEKLKKDADEYVKLKDQVATLVKSTSIVNDEVAKFKAISQSIKEEDFELTKFANQLLELDKEKLELMRKIDALERLVAKMRRS